MSLKDAFNLKKLGERPKPGMNLYVGVAIAVVFIIVAVSLVFLLAPGAGNTALPMNQTTCQSTGGTWNDCGSLCLGQPAGTICPQVCVPQCEWYDVRAEIVRSSSAYNSQAGFSCMTQDNGILLCWLRPANSLA